MHGSVCGILIRDWPNDTKDRGYVSQQTCSELSTSAILALTMTSPVPYPTYKLGHTKALISLIWFDTCIDLVVNFVLCQLQLDTQAAQIGPKWVYWPPREAAEDKLAGWCRNPPKYVLLLRLVAIVNIINVNANSFLSKPDTQYSGNPWMMKQLDLSWNYHCQPITLCTASTTIHVLHVIIIFSSSVSTLLVLFLYSTTNSLIITSILNITSN